MDNKGSKALIGAFVLGALFLGATIAVIWGSGKFFTEKEIFVLFFDSSIKGLDIGAPVLFKGVKIGNVQKIDIKAAEENGTIIFWIPVYIEIDNDKMNMLKEATPSLGSKKDSGEARLKLLISQGLRGQLRLQSIVTGKLYIALDFFRGKPAKFVGKEQKYLEIPTVPTPFEEASDTALKIFEEIRSLPIKELLAQLNQMIKSLNALLARPDTEAAIVNINSVLKDISTLVKNIDKKLGPMERTFTKTIRHSEKELALTLQEMRATLQQANEAIQTLKGSFGEGSLLQMQILKTLEEISKAARNLRLLADYLERHPEAIIKGKSKDREISR